MLNVGPLDVCKWVNTLQNEMTLENLVLLVFRQPILLPLGVRGLFCFWLGD